MGEVRHNCGLCITHTLHDAYNFLEKSLQHRGREAAGIAAVGEESIDVLKWSGSVSTFDVIDLHKLLPGHNYHTFLGHVRYATQGRKDKILEDAHPHVLGGIEDCRGSHVIIRNCEAAIVHNGQVDIGLLNDVDLGKMKTRCDSEAVLLYYKEKGEKEWFFTRTLECWERDCKHKHSCYFNSMHIWHNLHAEMAFMPKMKAKSEERPGKVKKERGLKVTCTSYSVEEKKAVLI